MQYGFYFDNSRCTGCKTCEFACKDYKDLDSDFAFRKVYDYEGGDWKKEGDGTYTTSCFLYHVSISCNHCDNPACAYACPTHAMHKDEKTGLVTVDASKCIGCGYCAMACPYNAPKVDKALGHSTKCDGCADRVAEGLNPICVDACPLRALEFGDIEKLRAEHGDCDGIAPMPDSKTTKPNIVIKKSPAAKMPGDSSGVISNTKEVN